MRHTHIQWENIAFGRQATEREHLDFYKLIIFANVHWFGENQSAKARNPRAKREEVRKKINNNNKWNTEWMDEKLKRMKREKVAQNKNRMHSNRLGFVPNRERERVMNRKWRRQRLLLLLLLFTWIALPLMMMMMMMDTKFASYIHSLCVCVCIPIGCYFENRIAVGIIMFSSFRSFSYSDLVKWLLWTVPLFDSIQSYKF